MKKNSSNVETKKVLVIEFAGYNFTPEFKESGEPKTNAEKKFVGVWDNTLVKKTFRIPIEMLKTKFTPNDDGQLTETNLTELKSYIEGMIFSCCVDFGNIWPSYTYFSGSTTNKNWAAYANDAENHEITYTLWVETVNEEPLEAE